jgi:Glycosyltransferase family 87
MNLGRLLPWVPFGLLFLAPFFDPRRPTRLLHLDLLVLLGFAAIPLGLFVVPLTRAPPQWLLTVGYLSVVIGLVYVVARALSVGFRGGRDRDPLVPLVPIRWLVVGLILVMAFRVGYTLIDTARVSDVGAAGVVGADQISKGHGVYDGEISRFLTYGDTYGPLNYLSYIPFEQAIPLKGDIYDADAARVAATCFDLLTVLALLFVGRRLRPGREGVALGVALAYAWATYPYTLFVLRYSFNDALVAALMLGAFLALLHPIRRGAMLGLATAAKFVPVVLTPLFARGVGAPRLRSIALFAVAFVAVVVVLFLPFIPDGGVREIYDRTLGLQAARNSSVWDRTELSWLSWLVVPAQATVVALALLVAVRPAASAGQVAARAGAVMAALLLATRAWFPWYVIWFAPFVLIGLFAAKDQVGPEGLSPVRIRSLALLKALLQGTDSQ